MGEGSPHLDQPQSAFYQSLGGTSTHNANTTEDITVIGVAKTSLADIKQGSYIGVSGMPQPDGSQKAIAVHIFAEAQRGTEHSRREIQHVVWTDPDN